MADTKNSRVPLGLGEYEPPDKLASQGRARQAFLNAIADCAYEVLEDLFSEAFGPYCEAGLDDYKLWPRLNDGEYRSNSKAEQLRKVLLTWSNRWHLNEDWCRNAACVTLLGWRSHEQSSGSIPLRLYWGNILTGIRGLTRFWSQPFVFITPGWDPSFQRRESYERANRLAINTALAGYLDEMEEFAKKRDYVTVPRRFQPEHYEWLVDYQVRKMTYGDIAKARKSERTPKQTIGNRVNELAEFIGLTLTRGRGRPRTR